MNDLYVKYRSKLMLVDSMDMPVDVELAHRRLCDFIWAMDGPPSVDNLEVLQSLCRVSPANWSRVFGGLQAKGWHVEDGHLTHAGAMKTLTEAKQNWDAKLKQTDAARQARLAAKSVTTSVTTHVTESVTDNVTEDCNRQCNRAITVNRKPLTVNRKPKPESLLTLNRGVEEKKPSGQTKKFKAMIIANLIISNGNSWHWDNCKIPIHKIKARPLSSVIEPHADKPGISDQWKKAAREAHGAVVDGMPKAVADPVGYCIACFKARLNAI